MPLHRVLLPLAVTVAGVVAVMCVAVDPSMWIIVAFWAIGAAYTVGQIRTGYADPPPPPSGPVGPRR